MLLIVYKNERKIEDLKNQAIHLVIRHADERIRDYEEPTRAGTKKGEPVGLSAKKFRAAILLALYPKCLTVKEIAKLSGVSNDVLRVWRTEPEFQAAVFERQGKFGIEIARLIDLNISQQKQTFFSDDGFDGIKDYASFPIGVVLFFNSVVYVTVLGRIVEKAKHDILLYGPFLMELSRTEHLLRKNGFNMVH